MHLPQVRRQPAVLRPLGADPEVSDPLTASDFLVAEYADCYFEYDRSGG